MCWLVVHKGLRTTILSQIEVAAFSLVKIETTRYRNISKIKVGNAVIASGILTWYLPLLAFQSKYEGQKCCNFERGEKGPNIR